MSTPLLQLVDIKKQYGTNHALRGVSLEINAGEVFCLLGVNGAGKTTLSSIIATLHPPSSGSIFFKGKSVYEDVPVYRENIGYCAQKPNLNPLLTMQQNLQFAGEYYGMSRDKMAERFQELNQRLGIEEYLGSHTSELSGGWKQRYMIARTVLHAPSIVILDEPTVGLDPDIRQQLWYYIRHLRDQGSTIILTTHYLDEAEQLADRVCVLDAGQVKLIDTPKNLMSSYNKARLEDVFLQITKSKE